MKRVFAAATVGGRPVVHDPATGLTHLSPLRVHAGRHVLEEDAVACWPSISPADLDVAVPVSVCWSPIVRCNLACPHCLDDKSVPEAGTGERMRIAGILAASGVLGVDISGGEPLLLRDLPDLARRLASGGIAVSTTTNGWHLARRASELVGAVDAIRVSLDGPDPARHDAWRGRDSFARAVDGIRAAVEAGLRIQIQTVLMRSTWDSAQEMVDLAATLGAGGVTFLQMLPLGEGAALAREQMLTDAEAATTIAALRIPPGVSVRLRTREAAEGFTVVRADGQAWRNTDRAHRIAAFRPLRRPADLYLSGRRDGFA
ncbi:Molybdenum cofactor biosynthesis protein MoaA [Carbonactinospora thermoautotrophica]|uniref:Molybdenum cofactor biosynthesis protein MoaA n=2 Tax=Carbonactinospora thermoautotrophica TaxID=1469144 RepID=A0A132ML35_9ACTN|nr:radical SAM protein [Carbonactinospora thermoautotrophica]KWW98582.1 Molybdenum cofactor biosynthesis protein MoaA [Carbonactinospora thermoautotrophica]